MATSRQLCSSSLMPQQRQDVGFLAAVAVERGFSFF
jgi:hypothetical protein